MSSTKTPQVQVHPFGFTTLFNPTTNPAADVIFVHGLQGHPQKTWSYSAVSESRTKRKTHKWWPRKSSDSTETRAETTVFWPMDLLPDDQSDIRIMTYGYDSHVTKFFKGSPSQTTISEHGRSFLNSLASERRDCEDRPIIFVAHSLGGLIVKEAIRRSRESVHHEHLRCVYTSTHATIFFGVPHRGSGDAGFGEVLRRIASAAQFDTAKHILADLDPSSGSAKLDELSETFSDMLDEQGFQVYSFQESQGMVGFRALNQLVVSKESSALNERKYEIKDSINANHMNMCKFGSRNDAGYQKFMYAVYLYMKQIGGKKRQMAEASIVDPLSINQARIISSDERQTGTGHTRSPKRNSPIVMVPYTPNSHFIGRKDILEQLETRLADIGECQKRMALWGLGGVGKSQIAIVYAHRYQKRYPERSVLWIHASNLDRFSEGYLQISRQSSLPDTGDPKRNILVLVRDWLKEKNHGQWLMIIDNADDTELFFGPTEDKSQRSISVAKQDTAETLSQYIPDCAHGSILITTRNKRAAVKLTRGEGMIEVSKMGEPDSAELMRRALDTDHIQSADLNTLTALLDYLPLALAQAAAYIHENSLSVEMYLKILKAGKAKVVNLLNQNFEASGRPHDIPNAVAATWMISFNQIRRENPRAAELLSLMAFLDRQNIPQLFLLKKDEDPLDSTYLTACGELKAFSLVTETATAGTFDIHRLVQMVTQRWLINQGESEARAIEAAETVQAFYPNGQFETWNECAEYLPHAQAVIKQLSEFVRDKTIGLSLSSRVSTYLSYQGRLVEAEALRVEVMEISKRELGLEHPDTLTSMGNLASIYKNQGRLVEAEDLEVKVMKIRKRKLGLKHPDTLKGMGNLAMIYLNQGRLVDAEELEVKVVEIQKQERGLEHPDTLTSMGNLASTYWNQGRLIEAEELQMKVVEIQKREWGLKHPHTLRNMGNLASTYWNQGRLIEAEELEVKVVEIQKQERGLEHPDTLTSMGNLAFTYWNQGRLVEAEELEMKVMEIRKRALGLKHPDTLLTMNNLAWTFEKQGHTDKAIRLMTEVVDLREKTLGVDHRGTKRSIQALEKWQEERQG